MSKSKEELNALKEEVEAVTEKLAELAPEELAQVTGGYPAEGFDPYVIYELDPDGPGGDGGPDYHGW